MQRLVLDTNVWLDWLVFGDPSAQPIAAALAAGRAVIHVDAACAAEFVRVLGYDRGKRTLDAAAQAACQAQMCTIVHMWKPGADPFAAHPLMRLPDCRDPDDQKFLELARACGADFLVSRDRALLELGRRKGRPLPFAIVTPAALAHRLEAHA